MKKLLGVLAIAAMGFFATPNGAEAAPVVDSTALAPLAQQTGSGLDLVHWRPYRHCHRRGWRRYCHGGRRHYHHRRHWRHRHHRRWR